MNIHLPSVDTARLVFDQGVTYVDVWISNVGGGRYEAALLECARVLHQHAASSSLTASSRCVPTRPSVLINVEAKPVGRGAAPTSTTADAEAL